MSHHQPSLRVNKALVELGLANSRRKADQLILSHQVRINGRLAQPVNQVLAGDILETPTNSATYQVSSPNKQLILLNKPKGYLSSHTPQDAPTLFDLLPTKYSSYKIAGRLDKESRGLVILSLNGSIIQSLSHPSQDKLKYYQVQLDRTITDFESIKTSFISGIIIDNQTYQAQGIKPIKPDLVEIILITGKNRQIRKMFQAIGYQVVDLIRIRIGDYQLGDLGEGQYRIVQTMQGHPK
ncbi:rRNA pseudouridine synthase [Candidatus Saccharibacteria bacterium]|nr:rRNA pseudouridine synthase [Candidatus Saccharibacteria bacterium]